MTFLRDISSDIQKWELAQYLLRIYLTLRKDLHLECFQVRS